MAFLAVFGTGAALHTIGVALPMSRPVTEDVARTFLVSRTPRVVVETFGKDAFSGAEAGRAVFPFSHNRDGARPKAIAAISSIRAIAIRISGTSRIRPSTSAKADPNTK